MNDWSLDADEVHVIRRVLTRLIDDYDTENDIETKVKNERRTRLAVGLANHVAQAAKSADMLFDAGLLSDCVNAARRAFDYALTASWVAQEPKADATFHTKGLRATRALSQSIHDAEIVVPADALTQADMDLPKANDLENQLSKMHQLCTLFHPKLYVAYRLFCAHTHPSFSSVALMFGTASTIPRLPRLWSAPRSWAFMRQPRAWCGRAAPSTDFTSANRANANSGSPRKSSASPRCSTPACRTKPLADLAGPPPAYGPGSSRA